MTNSAVFPDLPLLHLPVQNIVASRLAPAGSVVNGAEYELIGNKITVSTLWLLSTACQTNPKRQRLSASLCQIAIRPMQTGAYGVER